MSIRHAIVRVVEGFDLTEAEARDAMRDIVEGEATAAQIAALMVGLRMKGETAREIAGLVQIMREYATRVEAGPDVVDLVGTGVDGARTFNISTISALAVAAAGAPVAKHGNRGVTSNCGSADILEALGVAIDLDPERVARRVHLPGFGFMFAPLYHPATRHAVAPRREIGVRTVFNLLGPLTNPAGATRQLTGVAVPEVARIVAEVLSLLGTRRTLVVHGTDGLDEISISAPTSAYLVEGERIEPVELSPERFGLRRSRPEAVRGGTVEENLRLARTVLAGEPSPARDVVLLNAGAGLFVAGLVADIEAGVERVRELLERGDVRVRLEHIRAVSEQLRREQSGADGA